MSKQLGLVFDAERCVQCHACEIACKSLHNVELGLRWRRVVGVFHGHYPNVTTRGISLGCMHCGDPACEAACPKKAIKNQVKDGIVLVDSNKCVGCRSCFLACPFGVPQFGHDGKMQKCNLCADRIAQGDEPACVETCPADALHFGTMEALSEQAAKRSAHRLAKSILAST